MGLPLLTHDLSHTCCCGMQFCRDPNCHYRHPPSRYPSHYIRRWVAGVDVDARSTRWAHFTNSASGLFCASLNQLDATKTVHPTVGFQRRGLVRNNSTSRLFYGAMAREYVCTENLTPCTYELVHSNRATQFYINIIKQNALVFQFEA